MLQMERRANIYRVTSVDDKIKSIVYKLPDIRWLIHRGACEQLNFPFKSLTATGYLMQGEVVLDRGYSQDHDQLLKELAKCQ